MKPCTCRYTESTDPKCKEPFDSPSAVRIHYRDAHGIAFPSIPGGGRRKLTLTGDHYILPQRLREAASQLETLAAEVEQYIRDTAEARERLKEYQALVDMAKKLR